MSRLFERNKIVVSQLRRKCTGYHDLMRKQREQRNRTVKSRMFVFWPPQKEDKPGVRESFD